MANHAAQGITRAGTVANFTAAANGDTCDTGDTTALVVKNGSGASVDITISATAGEGGLDLEDLVVTVAAGAEAYIGPIVASLFARQDNGKADIAYSALPTVTVACIRL